MDFILPRVPWRGKSVIEYGAQHGRHSIALIREGAACALAVEGRQANIDQAANPYPEKLIFRCLDVRRMANLGQGAMGRYDAGLVLGLLYHLDGPVAFLHEQLPIIKRHLFLWSHYADHGTMEQNGYRGAAWADPGQGSHSALEPLTAFWFTRDELLRCLSDHGFPAVDVAEMPTPVSPQYPAVMIYARRKDRHGS